MDAKHGIHTVYQDPASTTGFCVFDRDSISTRKAGSACGEREVKGKQALPLVKECLVSELISPYVIMHQR